MGLTPTGPEPFLSPNTHTDPALEMTLNAGFRVEDQRYEGGLRLKLRVGRPRCSHRTSALDG